MSTTRASPLAQVGGAAHRVQQGIDREPALFGRLDHFDLDVGGHQHAVQEGVGVGRLADRAGGHRADLRYVIAIQHPAIIAQDRRRGVDRALRELLVQEGVLAQPHRPPHAFQDVDAAVGEHLGHHHPHGVGADVDHRDDAGFTLLDRVRHALPPAHSRAKLFLQFLRKGLL